MSCKTCVRWARRGGENRLVRRLGGWRHWSKFGFCRWPGFKPTPYWAAAHPTGDLMTHESHGAECAARRAKKR